MNTSTTNIRIAGLGGMGILKSSQLLADALFRHGYDVKKAEVHGMSQRGGSVASDIRFGTRIASPMIPAGETDFLLILAPEEIEIHRPALRPGGILIDARQFNDAVLPHRRTLNIAMLGALSRHLDIPITVWRDLIRGAFPEKLQTVNLEAFEAGRNVNT